MICNKISLYSGCCKNNNSIDSKSNHNYAVSSPIINSADKVSFSGFSFSKENKVIGKQIIKLVKSKDICNIAILPHKCHDADAIGSAVALKRMIQQATGKIVDIFIEKPLRENFTFIDPQNEIKVVAECIGQRMASDDILNKYGKYDLVIAVDTAKKGLMDSEIFNAFMTNAKKTVDIDHHAKSDGTFADITLVDTSKKSASQLIMEFLEPFGINSKKVNKQITDPIAMGLVGDSEQFNFIKKGVFDDAEKLAKTSNIEKIITSLRQKTPEEFEICSRILSNLKYSEDGKVAYTIFENNGSNLSEKAMGMAIAEISRLRGVKYYFGITKNAGKDGSEISASIRSNDKAINKMAEELGGGGHDFACGIHRTDITAEEMAEAILTKLKGLIEA